ncbi:MAG: CvpA family protein [Bryobacteraceae bacterium]
MNWLDISLLVALAISVLAGSHEGFARAGVGFLASVLGLVLGLHYYRLVALSFRGYITESGLANALGFFIVFIAVILAGAVVSRILQRFVHAADLTWLDRIMGGAFGVVRGLLWATIAILAIMAFVPAPRMVLANSRLAPCVMDAASKVAEASPEEVKHSFRRSYKELNKVLPEQIKQRLSKIPANQI